MKTKKKLPPMTSAIQRLILGGHKALLHPKYSEMTQEERLLRVVMMAYAERHIGSQHILEKELTDAMYCEICNTIGDDEFIQWGDKIKAENEKPDIDDD